MKKIIGYIMFGLFFVAVFGIIALTGGFRYMLTLVGGVILMVAWVGTAAFLMYKD